MHAAGEFDFWVKPCNNAYGNSICGNQLLESITQQDFYYYHLLKKPFRFCFLKIN